MCWHPNNRLIAESLRLADKEGAEYYTVHAICSFTKTILEKYGFRSVNKIRYAEYFANEPNILSRVDPEHLTADYELKKLTSQEMFSIHDSPALRHLKKRGSIDRTRYLTL